MDKWEYTYHIQEITIQNHVYISQETRKVLNDYGREGYELISSNPIYKSNDVMNEQKVEFWFKRKLKS